MAAVATFGGGKLSYWHAASSPTNVAHRGVFEKPASMSTTIGPGRGGRRRAGATQLCCGLNDSFLRYTIMAKAASGGASGQGSGPPVHARPIMSKSSASPESSLCAAKANAKRASSLALSSSAGSSACMTRKRVRESGVRARGKRASSTRRAVVCSSARTAADEGSTSSP